MAGLEPATASLCFLSISIRTPFKFTSCENAFLFPKNSKHFWGALFNQQVAIFIENYE